MPANTVAVIVPTLNEESSLRRCLAAAAEADEVVVADGGSQDGTVRVAGELGAHIVTGTPGRGPQMNRGAGACHSATLLFLHADSILPAGGLRRVRQLIREGKAGGDYWTRAPAGAPGSAGNRPVIR